MSRHHIRMINLAQQGTTQEEISQIKDLAEATKLVQRIKISEIREINQIETKGVKPEVKLIGTSQTNGVKVRTMVVETTREMTGIKTMTTIRVVTHETISGVLTQEATKTGTTIRVGNSTVRGIFAISAAPGLAETSMTIRRTTRAVLAISAVRAQEGVSMTINSLGVKEIPDERSGSTTRIKAGPHPDPEVNLRVSNSKAARQDKTREAVRTRTTKVGVRIKVGTRDQIATRKIRGEADRAGKSGGQMATREIKPEGGLVSRRIPIPTGREPDRMFRTKDPTQIFEIPVETNTRISTTSMIRGSTTSPIKGAGTQTGAGETQRMTMILGGIRPEILGDHQGEADHPQGAIIHQGDRTVHREVHPEARHGAHQEAEVHGPQKAHRMTIAIGDLGDSLKEVTQRSTELTSH